MKLKIFRFTACIFINIVISEILVKDNYDKITPRLKKCDRWSYNIAYGVKGSYGIWE